jgi:hypothetical protein
MKVDLGPSVWSKSLEVYSPPLVPELVREVGSQVDITLSTRVWLYLSIRDLGVVWEGVKEGLTDEG